MKFRFSILLKLLVFILPLVCLPIASVGYLSFQASVDRVDRLVRHEQMVQVKVTAGELNDIFYDCRLDLETIASLPVLEDYHRALAFRLSAEAEFNHDNIVRLFNDFITRTPYYRQIRYIDSQGRELIKVNRNDAAGDLYDRSRAAFFQRSRDMGRGHILKSDIVRSAADSGLVIHWSRAIFSGLREFTGVVVIDLDYEKIIRMVRQIKVEERGYAFLIDESGRLIAHPRFEPFSLDMDSYPDVSLKTLIREMMTGASEWRSYSFEGEDKVAAFAPIPSMKWSLAVSIPRVDFRKEALVIRDRVIQAVGLTLLLAVAGVTVLTYFLLKPVRTLVGATKRIAAGDLNHEIPIQSSDELGDLTRSFNRMVKNLGRIQTELVNSEKLISMGRLSAGVAHEIRNPLNAMKGAIVYLQRRRPEDSLVGEYTHLVSEEIDRLSQFVTEFLYFARQSMPKLVLTDINGLVGSIKHLFEERARENGIRFHNQLATGLPPVAIDPHQFEQVIVNIVINAMDALPEGGDITFSSRMIKTGEAPDAARRFRLVVQDNGVGMSAHHVKTMFDPFFSTKEDGTGLGLPLSLGIVENHGGRIRISSQEGIGTAVIIEWPGLVELPTAKEEMVDENNSGS
ncbi:MAG: HAMP domain-containing protein [Desulfobacterales bacterium]|nr:HAMP domain-containing protein [Desulfobacterales bacterium]